MTGHSPQPNNNLNNADYVKEMEEKGFSSEMAESGVLGEDGESSSYIFHYDGEEWEEESNWQKCEREIFCV